MDLLYDDGDEEWGANPSDVQILGSKPVVKVKNNCLPPRQVKGNSKRRRTKTGSTTRSSTKRGRAQKQEQNQDSFITRNKRYVNELSQVMSRRAAARSPAPPADRRRRQLGGLERHAGIAVPVRRGPTEVSQNLSKCRLNERQVKCAAKSVRSLWQCPCAGWPLCEKEEGKGGGQEEASRKGWFSKCGGCAERSSVWLSRRLYCRQRYSSRRLPAMQQRWCGGGPFGNLCLWNRARHA